MFKSPSLVEHILRGSLGFGLLSVGLLYSSVLGWWNVLLLAGALVCFRGCPTCWISGLVEAVIHRNAPSGCVDGSCGRPLEGPRSHLDVKRAKL